MMFQNGTTSNILHILQYFGFLIFTWLSVMTFCNVIIILNITIMTTIINHLLALVFLLMKVNDMDLLFLTSARARVCVFACVFVSALYKQMSNYPL